MDYTHIEEPITATLPDGQNVALYLAQHRGVWVAWRRLLPLALEGQMVGVKIIVAVCQDEPEEGEEHANIVSVETVYAPLYGGQRLSVLADGAIWDESDGSAQAEPDFLARKVPAPWEGRGK